MVLLAKSLKLSVKSLIILIIVELYLLNDYITSRYSDIGSSVMNEKVPDSADVGVGVQIPQLRLITLSQH